MSEGNSAKARLFYSYSHADEVLRKELEKHLSILQRQGKIIGWNDRMIDAGSDWSKEIDESMEASHVILLLVSSDFIASDYCYSKELNAAVELQKEGKAIVIPIILRACDWHTTVLGDLQALPKDGRPVTSWENKDEAWTDIAKGIRNAINKAKFHEVIERSKLYTNKEDKVKQGVVENVPEMVGMKECLTRAVERIDRLFTQEEPGAGFATSFEKLDVILGGVESGDFVVVSGRTGVGKTSFVTNIVESLLVRDGKSIALFSQEIDEVKMTTRLMTSLARIDYRKLRDGLLEDDDWPRLTSAVGILSEAKLFIGHGYNFDIDSITKRLESIQKKNNLDVVVIDGLHLVSDSIEGDDRAYTKIAHKLKVLANKLDVAVIVTLPIGFECDARPNKRPTLYDLRKYGDIEQISDTVIFIYRDEMYNEDSPDLGTAEIILSKNRRGQVGVARLAFIGKYLRFENLADLN